MPPFVVWTWTQESSSIRTAGSKGILFLCIEFKGQNVLSVMDLIKLNITITLHGVVRQTLRPTFQDLKQSRVNYTPICLNAWTIKAITKPIWMLVLFGNIVSIKNGIQKNTKKSGKPGKTWFALLKVLLKHNYQKSQDILTEYSKKQSLHRINIRNPKKYWYPFHSRASIVIYMCYSKFFLMKMRTKL